MGKIKSLLGVVNDLADSVVSTTNRHFLTKLSSLPIKKTKRIEIDLLNETIYPEELMSDLAKDMISYYRTWLFSELKKLKIEQKDIDQTVFAIFSTPGHYEGRSYVAYRSKATILSKGKEYTKESTSSWIDAPWIDRDVGPNIERKLLITAITNIVGAAISLVVSVLALMYILPSFGLRVSFVDAFLIVIGVLLIRAIVGIVFTVSMMGAILMWFGFNSRKIK